MAAFNHTRGEYVKPGTFLPDGYYYCECIESNFVDNNAGTGKVLKLTWEINGGEHDNKKIFDNLSLVYPNNPTVVKIAENTLNGILEALALPKMTDTDEILHKKVTIQLRNYTDKNGKDKSVYIYHPAQRQETATDAGVYHPVYHPTEASTPPAYDDDDITF
jgi:hypothetical protein